MVVGFFTCNRRYNLYDREYDREFNVGVNEANMSDFLNIYSLKNLVKQKACYKNPEKLPSIDLDLINCQRKFQNTCVFETGRFDFHKLTITVINLHFPKQKPKIMCYRVYQKIRNAIFSS